MSIARSPLLTNDPISTWARDIQSDVRQQSIVSSRELQINSSPFGSQITLRPEQAFISPSIRYRGEWNITAEYNINDVVRVLPNKTYSLPWDTTPTNGHATDGTPILTGTIENVAMSFYDYRPIPGVYICTVPVPSLDFTIAINKINPNSAYVPQSTVNPDNVGYILSESDKFIQNNIYFLRFSDVNVYPVYPELPDLAYLDIYDISKLNGRYWDLISLMPEASKMCVGGVESTYYIDAQSVPTGSANYTGSIVI